MTDRYTDGYAVAYTALAKLGFAARCKNGTNRTSEIWHSREQSCSRLPELLSTTYGSTKCRRPSSLASVVTFEAARRLQRRPGNAGQYGASGVVRASAPLSLASQRRFLRRCVTEDGRRVSCRRCRCVHYDRDGRRSSLTAVVAVCGGQPFSSSSMRHSKHSYKKKLC